MRFFVTPSNTIEFKSEWFRLRAARPVVNGLTLYDCPAEVLRETADELEIQYHPSTLPGVTFSVEVRGDALRYWLQDMPPDFALDSFGLRFEGVENLRAFLQNGYHSWDASAYVEPERLPAAETEPRTGYAMTQLLPRFGAGSLILGFERHDRFQHTFTFDLRQTPPALEILTLWDQKDCAGGARCESERLRVIEHTQVEAALREWACCVAQASPLPPRVSGPPITGWSSWYNLYSYISEAIISEHLKGVRQVVAREHLPLRVFQIDDGFTLEMGDWLECKPQFPRGMKPLLDDIRNAGFIPGLWIAPLMVGNRSHLYREHPDWVIRERATGEPLVEWLHYGELRWHKRSEEYYILDTTHPDAFEYIRRVFHTWRHEWGCEYFKTDFVHYGSAYGPDRAVRHSPGATRIEIWRRFAEMIRHEIGEALWLGSGCPLWASVGLVDAVRIGQDVGVQWDGELSAQSLLGNLALRNFANQVLWQGDPDAILLRERFHELSNDEVTGLALYAGMSGGVVMTSDALDELSPERLRLLRLVVGSTRATGSFPLLGKTDALDDPVLVEVRPGNNQTAILLLNTGTHPVQRTLSLAILGLDSPQFAFDWDHNCAPADVVEQISVTLAPHASSLWFLSPERFSGAPERLP